jgi:hypothetical protein
MLLSCANENIYLVFDTLRDGEVPVNGNWLFWLRLESERIFAIISLEFLILNLLLINNSVTRYFILSVSDSVVIQKNKFISHRLIRVSSLSAAKKLLNCQLNKGFCLLFYLKKCFKFVQDFRLAPSVCCKLHNLSLTYPVKLKSFFL